MADDEILFVGLTHTLAGFLPTAGHPNRSCPHLVLCQSEWTLGIMFSLRLPVSHRGLAPHQFTPMPGVPRSLQPTCYPYDCSTVNEDGKLLDGSSRFGKARTRLDSALLGKGGCRHMLSAD